MRTKRSHYNVNRMGQYNRTDARIDHPHSPIRTIGTIVREANEIKFRPKGKKVA